MTSEFNDPSWPSSHRKLIHALSTGFIVVVLVATLLYIVYPWPVFGWQQLQELQPQDVPLYAFERGNLDFTLTGENYILFERWTGEPIRIRLEALDVYFAIFAFSLSILLALVSTLPRFTFYAGALLTAFLLASFQWQTLALFGLTSRYAGLIPITAYLGGLSLFQFFRRDVGLGWRVLVFLLLTACMGLTTHFAGSPGALHTLAANTLTAAIILLLLFVIIVAHQLIASFVTLAVSASRTHSLRPFLLISTIYLLNLWVAYLSRIGSMDWKYTIPSFILLLFSAVLTVWTIRQRMPIYENLVTRDSLLVVFITSLATLALAVYGFFMATANDVALLSISDLILYAHIGFGMMFVIYIASNFLGMFEKNLAVNKVLYKPTAMPYFSYRLGGLIFTLALIFYNNWVTHVNHFVSAYYTVLGDMHAGTASEKAMTYYRWARLYAFYNQHASTALAEMEGNQGNYTRQLAISEDANVYQPTEFTLLNTEGLYLSAGNAYDEIMLLRDAKRFHPHSGPIMNNLGLVYSRTRRPDSAEHYFRRAREDSRTRRTAEMNLIGMLAKRASSANADSIFHHADAANYPVRANALALANHQGAVVAAGLQPPRDSVLNLFTATEIANFLTNHTNQADTTVVATFVALAHRKENLPFRHLILPAAAKAFYASGMVNRAVELLQETVFLRVNEGYHNYTLGLMMMDQDKYEIASEYFLYAINHHFGGATLANAVSLAEAGRIGEAIITWDSVSRRKDSVTHELGESMKRVLAAPESWFDDLSETEQLYYALYRIPLSDSTTFNRLIGRITNEDLRAKAYLFRARKYYAADEIKPAVRQYTHLQGLHLRDTELFAEIKYFELRLLAAEGRIGEAKAIIDQGVLFGPYHESERAYLEGLLFLAAGDSASARNRFYWLARNNWYFDDGVVAAASLYANNRLTAYQILADALQVNQYSVKILKAYILVAAVSGFDPYAADALQTLRSRLSKEAFNQFVTENRLQGLLLP